MKVIIFKKGNIRLLISCCGELLESQQNGATTSCDTVNYFLWHFTLKKKNSFLFPEILYVCVSWVIQNR